jgi:hypothetical protein
MGEGETEEDRVGGVELPLGIEVIEDEVSERDEALLEEAGEFDENEEEDIDLLVKGLSSNKVEAKGLEVKSVGKDKAGATETAMFARVKVWLVC